MKTLRLILSTINCKIFHKWEYRTEKFTSGTGKFINGNEITKNMECTVNICKKCNEEWVEPFSDRMQQSY